MATTIPDVEFCLVKEDSADILVTVRIPSVADPAVLELVNLDVAVDGTVARPCILRFAVKTKDSPDVANDAGLLFKSSHFPDQIDILAQSGATLGQARVLVDKPDTTAGDADESYCHDLEVTQQDALRTGAQTGTIEVQASPDGATVLGVGTAFLKAKVGDTLQVLDGNNNATPALIESIASDVSMVVSLDTWVTPAAGLTFEIRRGKHTTAARGAFVLETGQVKG